MSHFEKVVESNKDCDFVQAMLNNFVKNHSEIIMEDNGLTKQLSQIREVTKEKYGHLEHLLNGNLCMTQYFAAIDNF